MPATSLATPATAEPEPQHDKRVRIPKNIVRACNLLATGECKTVTAAAERVGITREWLSRLLQRSHIRAYLQRKAAETIATASLRASNRLVELIDAKSEHVAAQVSERILTSEGILKSDAAQVSVNVDVRAGYVLDLTEPKELVIEHDVNAKRRSSAEQSDG